MFSFIDKSNVVEAFGEAEDYMRPIFEPFDEAERLARNKPHPNIPHHLPKVTEGTLSSTIVKQPRRIIQQQPAGKVKFSADEGLAPVLQYMLDKVILTNANTGGSPLQKAWEGTQKALTYGSQPRRVFFTQRGDYFGADYYLPYIKNVFIEKGQLCTGDANLIFERQRYTKSQIKGIINQEKYLARAAKERGEKYKSSWDLKALASLLDDSASEKHEEEKTPTEKALNISAGGYELVTAYQTGVGAEFYTFAPALDNKVIRVKVNPDPRGKIPIIYQYHTVDGGSPLGRGAPEHSGAIQNLLDSQLQMFQYGEALRNAPPIKKYGSYPDSTIRMVPDAIWDMGNDKTNDAVPVTIAPQGNNFTTNFQTVKSILITGLNGADTSIGAQSGNIAYSKTNAGVKQQQAVLGVDDNYIRKQYEAAESETFETLLNIHVAETVGTKEFAIEGDDLEKIAAVYPEVMENGGRLNILFDRIAKAPISFEVDAGTSAGDDDEQQSEILKQIADEYSANPIMQQKLDEDGYEFKLGELLDRRIKKSGVEDPEKIIRKLTDEELAQKQQEQMQQQMQMQQMAEPTEEPIAEPMEAQMQEQPIAEPMEQEFSDPDIDSLRAQGLGDNDIQAVIDLFNQGATVQEVMAQLGGV